VRVHQVMRTRFRKFNPFLTKSHEQTECDDFSTSSSREPKG